MASSRTTSPTAWRSYPASAHPLVPVHRREARHVLDERQQHTISLDQKKVPNMAGVLQGRPHVRGRSGPDLLYHRTPEQVRVPSGQLPQGLGYFLDDEILVVEPASRATVHARILPATPAGLSADG